MRRLLLLLMLLALLVGAASAQVTRDWSKRSSLPDSGNNLLIKTVYFTPSQPGQSEALFSLSSVTMLDGRVVFQVLRRSRNGDVVWSRVGTITTGNQKVFAKDIKVDSDGNVLVLADIKQRADYDVVLYRYSFNGTAGAKTTIRDKWQDDAWNIHDTDERAVSLQVNQAGEAFVLLSEEGNPALGKYGSLYKINTGGSVMWSRDYRNAAGTGLVGEIKNLPKAMDIDSSGNVYILSHVNLDFQLDNFAIASFDTNGNLRSNVAFGYSTVVGSTTVYYEDFPVDLIVDGAGGVYVVGTTTFYENRAGTPYAISAEIVGRLNGATLQWGYVEIQRDAFFRPGQFTPRSLALTQGGGVATVGGVEPYNVRSNAYVRSFPATGGAPLLNYNGPSGIFNALAVDGSGNLYPVGAQYFKVTGGWQNKGVLQMLSPTGSVIFTENQSLKTVNPGTQSMSVQVNGAGDIYVGSREFTLEDDGTTTYAVVGNSRFVQDPVVTQMTITPSSIGGGQTFKLHVELSKRAFAGGYTFKLQADKSGVNLPASFTVPANEDEWDFEVGTGAVSTNRTVTLAVLPAKTVTASITIFSGWVKGFSLNSYETLGGTSVIGTVTLNAPAPSGGARIELSADPAASIVLPKDGFITVPSGATQRQFSIGTRAVGTVTDAFVGVTFNSTARAKLTIRPAQITGFTVPTTIQGGTYGNATVTLSGKAPSGGLPVTLVTDSEVLAGMTVLVPENQTTFTFRLNTLPVAVDTDVHLTAKTSTASMPGTVKVLSAALKSVSMDPSSVTGGATAYVVIELTGQAPSGGLAVKLTSSSSVATVSSSAFIAAGKKIFKVAVKTTAVTSAATADINVTINGITKTGTLTINPAP
jgi:hypothetical protein